MAAPTGHTPPGSKKKEIYKYLAPWTVYGMNWSVRQDKRFRIAFGSFIEDYSNKVSMHDVWYNGTFPRWPIQTQVKSKE